MIVRTEYSFRQAFGTPEAVLARLPEGGIIADDGCWGHVPWAKASLKAQKRWGLAARLRVATTPEGKSDWRDLILVPRTGAGLRELYRLTTLAQRQFHYFPRLIPGDLPELGGELLAVAAPGRSGEPPALPKGSLVPHVPGLLRGRALAFSDNFYPAPTDRAAWGFATGSGAGYSAAPAHILTPAELAVEGAPPEALAGNRALLESIDLALPKAENIRFKLPPGRTAIQELAEQCRSELMARPEGRRSEYRERLERELALIEEKGFADYFLVIAEMISWAKERMLVGPGRGSSAGSIACWLLRITEVDPLRFGLLFERFIDTNRFDLPDIDIDFPDDGREAVLRHLADLYGEVNVAHIGTVMRFKPKSALTDVAKELKVPDWKLNAVKDVLIERSSGDSRVNDCLRDTLESIDAGRKLLTEHPEMAVACELEGAARQSGKHAAGMIVCNEAVQHFCSVARDGVAQIDKKSAEALNILKIDALGLRTLAVLDEALALAGLPRETLYGVDLEDQAAFNVINTRLYAGIFQFEGRALQSLASQVTIRRFADVAALTALARPGPLASGEAMRWVLRSNGKEAPEASHPMLTEITSNSYGCILYQEQVMTTCREIGKFSWADTAAIRKLMSNRVGDEAFRNFEEQFMRGAAENGLSVPDATRIWKAINTMGSWAFNLSHAVVYGVVSYWCAWMKAHHPLEFAAGCLRHAKDTESALQQLRELAREGIEYVPFDAELSEENWSVQGGKLIGGLTGLPGVGQVTAKKLLNRRLNNIPLTDAQQKLLQKRSVFADAFPCRQRFGHIYKDPRAAGVLRAPLVEIDQLNGPGHYVLIGRLAKKQTRDMNEAINVQKRGGKVITGPHHTLVFFIEDDSGRKLCQVDRYQFESLGKPIVEKGIVGKSWLMIRGRIREGNWDGFYIEALRFLGDE